MVPAKILVSLWELGRRNVAVSEVVARYQGADNGHIRGDLRDVLCTIYWLLLQNLPRGIAPRQGQKKITRKWIKASVIMPNQTMLVGNRKNTRIGGYRHAFDTKHSLSHRMARHRPGT